MNDIRDWKNWVTLAARLILGVVLIWAGISKAMNLRLSVSSTLAYRLIDGGLATAVGYALPFCEIGLGLLLVAGMFTRLAGVLGALMMLAFIIAIASVWARGISIDCGCFGSGGPISPQEAIAKYPWEIARDSGLLLCGAWLAVFGKPFYAIDCWLFKPIEQIVAEQGRKKSHKPR